LDVILPKNEGNSNPHVQKALRQVFTSLDVNDFDNDITNDITCG